MNDLRQTHGDPDDEDEVFEYLWYGQLLLRNWKVVLACILVSCGVAAVSAYLSPPLYRATTQISVEKEKVSLSDVGLTGQAPFSFSDPDFLPTQLQILKGREIIERIIARRQLVKSVPVPGQPKSASTSEATEPNPELDEMVQTISKRLQLGIVKGTTAIDIGYSATSGKEAAAMANAVVEAYIDWNRQSRIDQANQVSRFLESHIEQLKKDVEEKERRLATFGRSRDIVSMDAGKTVSMQKLEEFNKDYASAVADRVNKEAKYQQVHLMTPESLADQDVSVAGARTEQRKLEREYAEKLSIWKPEFPAMKQLEARIERGRRYLETTGLEAAKKARELARVELESARKREEVIRAMIRVQTSETLGQTVDAVEFTNMRSEISATRVLLDSMLKRQAETDVVSRMTGTRQANVRVISRAAVPTFRTSPSYRYNLYIGLLAGLVISVIVVVLIDRLDRSIRSVEQVEKILKMPALGIIPAFRPEGGTGRVYGYGYGYGYGASRARKKAELQGNPAKTSNTTSTDAQAVVELLPHSHPLSAVSEAYRAFRAMLLLSRAEGVRTVLLTSAVPGEGKTTTALNLAVALGQLGKRVLLIDCDLRKPRIHQILKLSNRAGVVTALVQGAALEDIVQGSGVPNLWVVTSGPMTPNPSGLLSSDAMKAFVEAANRMFDYVVIDSPPVQPVADALILAGLTDGVVLAVRGGKTPRELVIQVKRQLTQANVTVLGVLINNLEQRHGRRGDQSGYEYGYGEQTPVARVSAASLEAKSSEKTAAKG